MQKYETVCQSQPIYENLNAILFFSSVLTVLILVGKPEQEWSSVVCFRISTFQFPAISSHRYSTLRSVVTTDDFFPSASHLWKWPLDLFDLSWPPFLTPNTQRKSSFGFFIRPPPLAPLSAAPGPGMVWYGTWVFIWSQPLRSAVGALPPGLPPRPNPARQPSHAPDAVGSRRAAGG